MLFKEGRELKKEDFSSEKEMQSYFEANLKEILGLKFVASEFSVEGYRMDTIAFDERSKTFYIIEFKNTINRSLVDQGMAYLNVLEDRKAEFILKYNEVNEKPLKIKDVDLSQSRVIFISPEFSRYQIDSIRNLPVELYKVTKYEKNIMAVNRIKGISDVKRANISSSSGSKVLKEIKVYTEEDHLQSKSDKITEMYENLKEEILNLGNIEVDPKKKYIAFKGSRNIVDIEIQSSKLKMHINLPKGKLDDFKNLTIDQSNLGHWGNGDYRIDISNLNDSDYLMYLIKQSYEVNK